MYRSWSYQLSTIFAIQKCSIFLASLKWFLFLQVHQPLKRNLHRSSGDLHITLEHSTLYRTQHLLQGNFFSFALILILFREKFQNHYDKTQYITRYICNTVITKRQKTTITLKKLKNVLKIIWQSSQGKSKNDLMAAKNSDEVILPAIHHFLNVLKYKR